MPQFHGFKQALDGEMKRLQAEGAGIEKKRTQPITNEEEEKLWNEGVLALILLNHYLIP